MNTLDRDLVQGLAPAVAALARAIYRRAKIKGVWGELRLRLAETTIELGMLGIERDHLDAYVRQRIDAVLTARRDSLRRIFVEILGPEGAEMFAQIGREAGVDLEALTPLDDLSKDFTDSAAAAQSLLKREAGDAN